MRHDYRITIAGEAESLSYLASGESDAALQGPVIAIFNIIRIAISRPPTDQAGWNWCAARLALSITTDRIERRDLLACQRTIEDFYFVDLAVELAGAII